MTCDEIESHRSRFENPQRREATCEVRALGDRSLTFIASTERVARDGDIIEVAGWDTKEFMRNPVFLWAHDSHTPPIGRVSKVRKVRGKGEEKRLEIDVDFAGADQNHELADTVFRLYRDKFLNAVSVGFTVKGHKSPDDAEREKLGLGPFGHVITAAELLEVSAVPVPADPGAVLAKAAPDDLVRMRNALTGDARAAWDVAPISVGSMNISTSGYIQLTNIEPTLEERVETRIDALGAEILERIDTNFRQIENVLRLRDVPEQPAEAPRDGKAELDRFGDRLVRGLNKQEDSDNG